MSVVCCIMAILMASIPSLSGCGIIEFGFGGGGTSSSAPRTYTIQYTDDAGTHTLEVEDGSPYSLESVPRREGYDFIGLFDAEVGGTQYVLANGSSVSPFTDKQNMVLFPQYKAKQYTVILDYGGAAITGERQIEVSFGESLPELPKNLTLDHSTFSGWYTAANCGGVQVADEYGLVPVVSVVNSDNFDLTGEYITLYAGFETETFTVTFNFGNGIQPEEMQIAYNTPISQVVPETRNEQGQAVLSWSKTQSGDQIFTGNITDNTVLYAAEWAPVIELDPNGGEEIMPVVAKAGTSVTLPTPVRKAYKFMGWQTQEGEVAEIASMPENSVRLTAIWQAMLVFDENGGTEVTDISQPVGAAITLPTPEKEGYIFAGWYNADKEQYTATSMPAASEELKAGWYQAKTVKKTFLEEGDVSSLISWKTPELKSAYNINFSEEISEIDWTKTVTVTLNFCADFKHAKTEDQFVEFSTYATKEHFYFYSQEQVSDAYLIGKCLVDHGKGSVNESYTTTNFSITLSVTGGMIYTALGADKDNYYKQWGKIRCASGWMMTNFWVEIAYPDTTYLYL